MKACAYCGRASDAALVECPGCGEPLPHSLNGEPAEPVVHPRHYQVHFRLREPDARARSGCKITDSRKAGVPGQIEITDDHVHLHLNRQRLKILLAILLGVVWIAGIFFGRYFVAFGWPAYVVLVSLGAAAALRWVLLLRPLERHFPLARMARVADLEFTGPGRPWVILLEPSESLKSQDCTFLTLFPATPKEEAALQQLLPQPIASLTDPDEQDAAEFAHNFQVATPHVWVTYYLLGVNALIFMLAGLASSNLLAPSLETLLVGGANWGPLTVTGGGWWRLLAACFLHFNLLHLAGNLFALWQAGLLAERLFGNWYYLAVYLGAGLLASLAALDWHPETVSAGASGAVYGVYGGVLGYLLRQRGTVPRSVWASLGRTILAFVAFNLFYGLTQSNVDQAAHAGGLLGGVLLGWAGARPLQLPHRRVTTWRTIWQFAVVLAACLLPLLAQLPLARPDYSLLLNNLGESVAMGSGEPGNPRLAARWFQLAARLGSVPAEYNLGRLYCGGELPGTNNFARGVPWYRQAADHGSVPAAITLGAIYYQGQGVPRDLVQARQWIGQAAARGDAHQALLLGLMYLQGEGGPADNAAAFQWIHQAAEHGQARAQDLLAQFYLHGTGTTVDLPASVTWARRAVAGGAPGARLFLGYLYATGQGVAPDPVEALALLQWGLADGAQLPASTANLPGLLTSQMTTNQLAQAARRLRELQRQSVPQPRR